MHPAAFSIEALKDCVEKKNKIINKLRMDLKTAANDYAELQRVQADAEMNMTSTFLSQSRIADEKAKTAFARLLRHSKQQGDQIKRIAIANHAAAEVIDRQNILLDEFETQLDASSNTVCAIRMALDEANEITDRYRAEIDQANAALESRTKELADLRRIIADCMESAQPRYVTTQEGLPKLLHKLTAIRIESIPSQQKIYANLLLSLMDSTHPAAYTQAKRLVL